MPRHLQKSPLGSSLSLLRHWLLSLHWSQWVRVPAETPRATQPSKGGLHPQGGLYGAPSLDPPESMDIPLDVYGNWTGQVWPSRGAGREETAPVFSTVCGRDVSSPLRPEDLSSPPGREPPSALGCDLPWVGPRRPPANSQDSFVSSNNVKSGASSDQDARPDILPVCPKPLSQSSESGVEFNPPPRVGDSSRKKKRKELPVQSC